MGEPKPTADFPALLGLAGRRAVIVGSGDRATSLAETFLAHGALVTVVTAAPTPGLRALADAGALELALRSYVRGDLAGVFLSVCLEDGGEVARAVAAEAEKERCLIHVAGLPELSSVSFLD